MKLRRRSKLIHECRSSRPVTRRWWPGTQCDQPGAQGQALGQSVSVICLEKPGVLAEQVDAWGGRLISLDKPPGIHLSALQRLRAILQDLEPDIIHTHQIGTLFYAGPAAVRLGRFAKWVWFTTEHGREPYAKSQHGGRWLGRYSRPYTPSDSFAG